MDISVTDFKAHCLDLIRNVETTGKGITIRRHGRIVARLEPAASALTGRRPWEQLQYEGGAARIAPEESGFDWQEFDVLR